MADVSRMRSEITVKKANWGARAWNKMRDGDIEGAQALFKTSLAEVEALELQVEAKAKMIVDRESERRSGVGVTEVGGRDALPGLSAPS